MNKSIIILPFVIIIYLPSFNVNSVKEIAYQASKESLWFSLYQIDSNLYINEKVFEENFITLFVNNIKSYKSIEINYIKATYLYDGLKTIKDKGNEVYIYIDYSFHFLKKKLSLGARIKNG